MKKLREFQFSFVKEPQGYSVIWHMDKCDIYPIEDFKIIHTIEADQVLALLRKCEISLNKIMLLGLSDDTQQLPPNQQSEVAYNVLAKIEESGLLK